MTTLRQLLATWENWSARDTLTRALPSSATTDARARISASLAETPSSSALEALRASTELVELLTGWQWQAMHAARCGGASWEEIGSATRASADTAREVFVAVLDRQERVVGRDVSSYRTVL